MKRNEKGQFSTEQKKDFRIRVTKEEKEMIEQYRQNKYENCVICDAKLEKTSENFNGAEWCCPSHTESEWTYWCENAKQCEKCESYCYKISNENTCCACDIAQKGFACDLCQNRV